MSTVLAVDVGGTKTLLRLLTDKGVVISGKRLENDRYPHFEGLLATFLANESGHNIAAACIAVAGPVAGRQARLTNLAWHIDADRLAQELGLPWQAVRLCNDFEALATAIPALSADQSVCLQPGMPDSSAPIAIIGAGTGLGQAYAIPDRHGNLRVVATEGGHTDFAPTDGEQQQLLSFLQSDFAHVSYERLLSGAGIVRIYQFLAAVAEQPVELTMPAEISDAALSGQNPLARRALEMFVKIYGAQAGNLALTTMPRGGMFIAGGIAPQILPILRDGPFLPAFLAKGRMQPLMKAFPVSVITDTAAGLTGASILARQAMYNDFHV